MIHDYFIASFWFFNNNMPPWIITILTYCWCHICMNQCTETHSAYMGTLLCYTFDNSYSLWTHELLLELDLLSSLYSKNTICYQPTMGGWAWDYKARYKGHVPDMTLVICPFDMQDKSILSLWNIMWLSTFWEHIISHSVYIITISHVLLADCCFMHLSDCQPLEFHHLSSSLHRERVHLMSIT